MAMWLLGLIACAGLLDEPIDPCRSLVIGQARAAVAELRLAERVHGGEHGTAFEVVYEGTVAVEAHLMRPGMVRTLPVRIELVVDGDGMTLKESSGPAGSVRVETTVVLRERVAEQAGQVFKEVLGQDGKQAAAEVEGWFPATMVRGALQDGAACRVGSVMEEEGRKWLPVTIADRAHRVCTLLLDDEHRVGRVERLAADQRLGDVCNWVRYEDWEEREGTMVPRRVSRFVVVAAATVRYDLNLVSFKAGPAQEGAFALPEARRGDIPDWGSAPKSGMEFVAVAPSVWAVEIAEANSRVLVIEREKDLVTLGAPDGDAVCGALVKALKERFGKPMGIAAFGHHHPSPSGGLRAMAAAGAVIVGPRGLEEYVTGLMSRPVGLGGTAVRGSAPLKAEWFEGERTIECGGRSVRLIDIEEKSAHAFHYVVFYLPLEGVVFEDDLGYFPTSGAARISPRLKGLIEAFGERRIEPKRLIQAWPVRDVKREVEWGEVEGLGKQ